HSGEDLCGSLLRLNRGRCGARLSRNPSRAKNGREGFKRCAQTELCAIRKRTPRRSGKTAGSQARWFFGATLQSAGALASAWLSRTSCAPWESLRQAWLTISTTRSQSYTGAHNFCKDARRTKQHRRVWKSSCRLSPTARRRFVAYSISRGAILRKSLRLLTWRS